MNEESIHVVAVVLFMLIPPNSNALVVCWWLVDMFAIVISISIDYMNGTNLLRLLSGTTIMKLPRANLKKTPPSLAFNRCHQVLAVDNSQEIQTLHVFIIIIIIIK